MHITLMKSVYILYGKPYLLDEKRIFAYQKNRNQFAQCAGVGLSIHLECISGFVYSLDLQEWVCLFTWRAGVGLCSCMYARVHVNDFRPSTQTVQI